MNHRCALRLWKNAALCVGAVAIVSACGFKGPLVIPPEQPVVEQIKIGGSTAVMPVDETGMGVKK